MKLGVKVMLNNTFETPRPTKGTVTFVTKLRDSEFIRKVAVFELHELKRVTKFAGNVELPSIDDMERYLKTALYLRVEYVTKGKLNEYAAVQRTIRIPERWYTILVNVGEAKNQQLNFKFVPEFSFDNFEPMSVPEIKEISELFDLYLQDGYGTLPGLPKSKDGSLHFMAKTIIGDTVRGIDVDSPVYAFLASVVNSEIINDTYKDLDLLFRVNYSDVETYELNFNDYFRQVMKETGVEPSTGVATQQDNNRPLQQNHTTGVPNDGIGPSQPQPGTPPPNLGHNEQGAFNDNGNLKD